VSLDLAVPVAPVEVSGTVEFVTRVEQDERVFIERLEPPT